MAHTPKLLLILRVRLDAQAGREDELADGGAEAGEEGVEGLVSPQRSAFMISFHPVPSSHLLPASPPLIPIPI